MIYTERDKLTVISAPEKKDVLSLGELVVVLSDRPSDTIYVEQNAILYGVVNSKMIKKAVELGWDHVEIERNFTYVRPNEYMRARKIFKDIRTTLAVPVVDEHGVLMGDYTKWDDIAFLERPLGSLDDKSKYGLEKWESRVILIKPCELFKNKIRLFEKWKSILADCLVSFETMDRKYVVENFESIRGNVVFIDKNEQLGTESLLTLLYKQLYRRGLDNGIAVRTMKNFWSKTNGVVHNQTDRVVGRLLFQMLQKQGVSCFGVHDQVVNEEKDTEFMKQVVDRFYALNVPFKYYLYPQMKKDFYEEIYNKEYEAEEIPFECPVDIVDGYFTMHDSDKNLFHIDQGERVTVNQPETYDRCIYLFGLCTILGLNVEDKYTVPSWLQEKINCAGFSCKVVNLGMLRSASEIATAADRIAKTPIKSGDIVILQSVTRLDVTIPYVAMKEILENDDVPTTWFVDVNGHGNHKANELLASSIYEMILPTLKQPVKEQKLIENQEIFHYIYEHLAGFDVNAYKSVGAIVMNCNPFTFGHRYLIEEASKKVDCLIIFVVQEDKSLFSFDERFAMVCAGTADLKNVKVVPSGIFVLSQSTFPEYFVKVVDEDLVQNVEKDIRIFAERIAPPLHITHRFVGEELEDVVTNEYNNAMKRILPSHGIELVEIPRKKMGDQIISASHVRRCIEQGDTDGLDSLVPESTKKILYSKKN